VVAVSFFFENCSSLLRLLQKGKVCSNGVLSGFTAGSQQAGKGGRNKVMGLV